MGNELAIVLDPSIAKKSPILSDSLKSSNAEFVLKDQDFEGKITERLISDVSTKIDSRYKAESVLDSNKLISKRKFTQVVGFSDREENMSKTIRDEMISKDSIFSSNEYEKNLIERKENNRNIKPKIEKLDDANSPKKSGNCRSSKEKRKEFKKKMNDSIQDAFPLAVPFIRKLSGRRNRKPLKINIIRKKHNIKKVRKMNTTLKNVGNIDFDSKVTKKETQNSLQSIAYSAWLDDNEWRLKEQKDPLLFFSELHEEQDSAYLEFIRGRERKRSQEEMQKFQGEEELKRYKLVSFMKSKWIEQKNAFKQEEINLYRNMKEKQSMQYKQLQSSQKEKIDELNQKIVAGRDMLSSNQKIEKDQFSIKNQIASINDVQELERNHKIQKDKFHAGAQEMFDNSQAKYGAKLIVLKKHHNRRQEELKQSIKMLQEKFMQLQKQQRLKHLQQHEKLMQIKKK